MPGVPCLIPPANSIYDHVMIALNEKRIQDAISIYNKMTEKERHHFMVTYTDLYNNFCKQYFKYSNGI